MSNNQSIPLAKKRLIELSLFVVEDIDAEIRDHIDVDIIMKNKIITMAQLRDIEKFFHIYFISTRYDKLTLHCGARL